MLSSMFKVLLLAGLSTAHGNHQKRYTKASLNTTPHNLVSNNGGPTIYYNGSGTVPGYDVHEAPPAPITPYTSARQKSSFLTELQAINSKNSAFKTQCQQCIASTEVLHFAAITQSVGTFTNLLIDYCNDNSYVNETIYSLNCHGEFAVKAQNASFYHSDAGGEGPYWAQLYAMMSQATGDMQAWCYYHFYTCDAPEVIAIDESQYFSPKPASAEVAPAPSGQTIQVLHLSDWHIDPRYDIGSEANCTDYLCCRPYAVNSDLNTGVSNPSLPASRFGSLFCDAPADLAISSFTTMNQFFNTNETAFTIFTGDIISHDNTDQLSIAYTEYNERQTYETFHAHMPGVPVYATLGNHDNFPEAYNTPNNINKYNTSQANPMSYNYELLSSLWEGYGWITGSEEGYASKHYGAYAHTTKQGLRIISFNTDFWYTDNVFNYYNFTNPDNSGVLTFVANELAACEKKGQRAWVIGHVLSGYDSTNALPNPSALFYSIIARYSPATIAAVFFGHTHEDQLMIYYDYLSGSMKNGLRNTTMVDYTKPVQMGFIGPSITPLTGNNAGYQLLQVDAKTFSVMGYQTYIANVSESLTWQTPQWQFEYDARKTYNVGGINWPKTAPLNATFYDKVTDVMLNDQALVERYNLLETKSAIDTESCTTKACGKQKVCYIRSGSSALGLMCPQDDGPF